ncbi:GNAT family N-acetyltransferase [Paenibacillus sp. MDMC362]|uniref:GNAT family N-acetyltransferase n=1 Tax=Paenibacillus sp. MDMC362 TaxID=2977365 RepID=UPI000DC22F0F|nr:GNAT family N-acetyltransferase [Paenibacillus sp. MDMC362]RAR42264.1 N-acetyltransferase [Paenibacillus sp. MDMC362]
MSDIDVKQVLISSDPSLLDLDAIVHFLRQSYWANERSDQKIKTSLEGSTCFGAYYANRQIGFARVVSDGATVYWLCDVFVDEAYRGIGVGKKLIETITTHGDYRNVFGILATRDAHGLYEQYGFVRDHGKTLTRMPDFLRKD